MAIDAKGALLTADDVGDIVWRVSAGAPTVNAAAQPPRVPIELAAGGSAYARWRA